MNRRVLSAGGLTLARKPLSVGTTIRVVCAFAIALPAFFSVVSFAAGITPQESGGKIPAEERRGAESWQVLRMVHHSRSARSVWTKCHRVGRITVLSRQDILEAWLQVFNLGHYQI